MKKKLLDLLAKKKAIVDQMRTADAAADQAAFDAAQAELAPVDAEIARVRAIMAAEEGEPEPEGEPAPAGAGRTAANSNECIHAFCECIRAEIARVRAIMAAEEGEPEPEGEPAPAGAGRTAANSNECIHAFCECIRAGAANDRQRLIENRDIVHRAVRNEGGMTEGTPADGGLIVPPDIQTMIREQMRALNPLSELFSIENVTSNTGSRVMDTAPTKGFTKVAEMAAISKDDKPAFTKIDFTVEDYALIVPVSNDLLAKPAFTKIDFTVEDYALIVPVSNDLLADTDQNLLAYLSRWMGKKAVLTENALLLALLTALDGSAAPIAADGALKSIKTLVNTKLDPIFGAGASYLTNQSGFNFLDTLEDGNGRPLLQVNPADRTQYMVGGRAVHVVSDAVLPNKTTAPLYVGDFKSFGTLFHRQPMEIASTNVGGNAWATNSTEVRAITRLAAKTFDAKAVQAGKITLA